MELRPNPVTIKPVQSMLLQLNCDAIPVQILFFIGLYLGLRAWQQRDMIQGEAPVFAAQRLDGVQFSMSDNRGVPLLLHFWATWCPVCRLEQNSIAGIAAKTGR